MSKRLDERCNPLYLIIILYFLLKDKLNWKNWNQQKLQTQISTPLRTSMNKRKSAAFVNDSASIQKKRSKENNSMLSVPKETGNKTSNRLKEKNNNRLKFDTLADNKIELVNLMVDNGKEKHKLEIEILNMQLQKKDATGQNNAEGIRIKNFDFGKRTAKIKK